MKALFAILVFWSTNAFSDEQFVQIEPGSFQMGSADDEWGHRSDETRHPVEITRAFEIQNTEVTQAQWFQVMHTNPSYFATVENCPDNFTLQEGVGICPDRPVENVTWEMAEDYTNQLSESDAQFTYHLPTEAQWEFAARGGSETVFYFGNDPLQMGQYGWDFAHSLNQTHPVAGLMANSNGIYDVLGNVWEWTLDWYAPYEGAPAQDPQGPPEGQRKVLRGGAWSSNVEQCRSATRGKATPESHVHFIGFRVTRNPK